MTFDPRAFGSQAARIAEVSIQQVWRGCEWSTVVYGSEFQVKIVEATIYTMLRTTQKMERYGFLDWKKTCVGLAELQMKVLKGRAKTIRRMLISA